MRFYPGLTISADSMETDIDFLNETNGPTNKLLC